MYSISYFLATFDLHRIVRRQAAAETSRWPRYSRSGQGQGVGVGALLHGSKLSPWLAVGVIHFEVLSLASHGPIGHWLS
jgi:hypothetical protein